MLNLARNCFTVFYKNFARNEDVRDQYGNITGSQPVYGELMQASLSVSSNKGDLALEMFGSLADYDRTMTTADTSCSIDEGSILWLDGADTSGPHNFVVRKRAPWKNSIAFAIKEVDVSNG